MVRVALGFANEAKLAQNNLGFRIAETLLAARGGVSVERFFWPAGERRAGWRLRTEPSALSLAAVDLVLFSLSFEGDFLHIPAMLAAGGLPPQSDARRRGHPLVVAGGAAVMINPEPIARFFDLFLVGEAEALLERFLDRWEPLRLAPREELLQALDGLPGSLAPALREHQLWQAGEGKLRSAPLAPAAGIGERADGGGPAESSGRKPASSFVATVPWDGVAGSVVAARLSAETHFHESLLLELERGCPRRCRFCVASRIYAPVRHHDAGRMVAFVEHELRRGERIGLLGLSAGDYPDLERLAEELSRCGWRLSISSLPSDFRRERVAGHLVKAGAETLTIAPEAGTDRLRALAGKRVANATIIETARMLGKTGVRELRTYFLIGLPFEEEADIDGIRSLLGELRAALPARCRLSATVNPFAPKPRTPFQWAGMASARALEQASRRLSSPPIAGVRLRVKSLREARVHAALTRADASWGARIERASLEGTSLSRQLRAEGTTLEDWTAAIEFGAALPWRYLISAEESENLAREWRRAWREAGRPEPRA